VTEKFKLSKTYDPAFEEKISKMWLESDGFHAVPDQRERTYVIMMPLPNVTGALHMGHAMDNVMQDMLIRWHRMIGDNTLWMPGTDHAGIATQAVVEKRIKELEGLTRHDVGREGLVERIWKWKDQFQARIYAQLQRIGCSADWDRARFTMDKVCSRAVRNAFFRMFSDGLVFRGKRLVAPGQLGPGAAHQHLRRRGLPRDRLGPFLEPQVPGDRPPTRRSRRGGGGHHPPGDHAGRHGGGGPPRSQEGFRRRD
jgi:isoleucyl-tRNA synthetase